jgi:hypothetical protein
MDIVPVRAAQVVSIAAMLSVRNPFLAPMEK